jgi:hypothetical protein
MSKYEGYGLTSREPRYQRKRLEGPGGRDLGRGTRKCVTVVIERRQPVCSVLLVKRTCQTILLVLLLAVARTGQKTRITVRSTGSFKINVRELGQPCRLCRVTCHMSHVATSDVRIISTRRLPVTALDQHFVMHASLTGNIRSFTGIYISVSDNGAVQYYYNLNVPDIPMSVKSFLDIALVFFFLLVISELQVGYDFSRR